MYLLTVRLSHGGNERSQRWSKVVRQKLGDRGSVTSLTAAV